MEAIGHIKIFNSSKMTLSPYSSSAALTSHAQYNSAFYTLHWHFKHGVRKILAGLIAESWSCCSRGVFRVLQGKTGTASVETPPPPE